MRRKSIFLCFIFLVAFSPFMISQQAGQDGLKLPSITPMNPETASLGRYGNLPINMGTGQMSYGIPIHTIQVDGNAWSVSLNYNYSGLILEAAPSLIGLGWGLNAHGAVRREIRGLPDGHENGYYGANGIQNKIPSFSDNSWNKYQMDFVDFQQFRDGKYDSEADKYTLSAGGVQVSFKLYFDSNSQSFKPYYITNHNNHNVIINMDQTRVHKVASFELITDNGVHYFFEDQETVYCEQVGNSLCPDDDANGWLLSRIEYLNGEEITFSYTPQTYYTYNFQASGAVMRQNIDGNGLVPVNETYNHNVRKNQVNRLLLNAITFPKGRIDFTTAITGNRTIYTNITVKGKNADETLTDVQNYSFTHEGIRDLLTSVTKNQELLFGFDYFEGPSGNMPPFVDDNYTPLDQDQWRYYNNGNNTHFFDMGVNNYQADRSIDFNKTLTGAMTSIHYPTGGRTNITYEQNSIREVYVPGTPGNGNTGYDNILKVDVNATMNNQDREDIRTVTFTEPVVAEISHSMIGDIRDGNYLRMGIEKIADAGTPVSINGCYQYTPIFNNYYPDVVEDARNKLVASTGEDESCIYYPNPPLIPFYLAEYGPEGCAGNGCVSNFYIDQQDSTQGSIVILPGTYRITVTTNRIGGNNNSIPHFTNGELSAHITLKWRDNPPSNGNNDPVYVSKNVGGVRVSKLEDIPVDGTPVVRNFNYLTQRGDSSGILNFDPQILFETKLNVINNNGSIENSFIQTYLSTAFSFLNTGEGVPVYYERVQEVASNGATTVTEYNTQFDRAQYQYPIVPREEYRSRLLPEKTYAYGIESAEIQDDEPTGPFVIVNSDQGQGQSTPAVIKVIQETNIEHFRTRKLVYYVQETPDGVPFQNRYDADDNHPWSFKLVPKKDRYMNFQVYDYPQYPDGNDDGELVAHMDLYAFYPYKEVEWDSRTESETKKYSGLTQKTFRTYDERNYLIKTESINSENDTLVVENMYPYNPLVASESQYIGMVSKNQINTPVLTETSQNDEVLSMQKMNFSQVIDGYKIQSIETSKTANANDLEERVVYEAYDIHGNITQVRKTNGQPVAYLWGYNRQYPVAKLENATIAQTTTIPGVGNIQQLDGVALQNALDVIRQALPNALVTSYTYKPLVGVTSVTDPRGYTMYYEYDAQNRLKLVKDKDGKVYSKNEYNYSTSN